MFTVAGLSRQNGTLKLRFANDFVTRVKVLQRNGHKDIELVELPQAMTKDAAVAYLSTLDTFKGVESQSVFSDYQSKNVKATPAPKAKSTRKAAKATEIDYATLDH